MIRFLFSFVSVSRTDGAILSAKGKTKKATALFLYVTFFVFLLAGSSSAASPSAGWALESFAAPTNFSAADNAKCSTADLGSPDKFACDHYLVVARNAGSEPSSGAVTLTDTLPAGMTVRKVQFFSGSSNSAQEHAPEDCPPPSGNVVKCTFPGVLAPDEFLRLLVFVGVNEPEVPGAVTNRASVSGGGATTVSVEAGNQVSPVAAPFGFSRFDFFKDGLDGLQDTQAGGHPYELTTTIDLNNTFRQADFTEPEFNSVQDVKDIVVNLPLGFAGSTLAAPECTLAQLGSEDHCPPATAVGHIFTEPENGGTNIDSPIWNLVPERGHPAEFGYIDILHGAHVAGVVSVVPTPVGYVLRFTAAEIPQVPLTRIVVTFFGDPALRDGTSSPQVPFFTNPTACANGPQVATIWMDSWQNPARFNPGGVPANLEEGAWAKATSESPAVTGCNALTFSPEISAQPTTQQADSPTGLNFEQRLAQTETVGVPATPALKNTTIVFPEGMTVDPSSADGLGVCTNAQIGWEGPTLFDFSLAPPACPESSKIGTLELETPLIPGVLHGEVFLAAQDENPFHSTFATYIVVNDPITGVVLKLAGELKADPSTGRLTAVFNETPQLPFSSLKVHFFGGPRAELATPPSCGVYTTTSELQPWSFPDSGPGATPSDRFEINENCATGFNPAFEAGTTNLQAGAFTPFVGSISRQDNDQELAGLTMNLPPGLLANVASVPLCPDAQANAGSCPENTQVGTVEAGAGPGPNPLFVPGKIYLTGPYKGGPYGLSVVVPANPGPFHFGLVVVRQSLRIDPTDAHVTDVSDPFPTFLDPQTTNSKGELQRTGIPIKLRRVDFNINRPGFTFNPTNCSKLQVAGAISSVQSQTSALSVPFQVTNCATLKFQPKIAVTTAAKTSKVNGASLVFLISYPKGAIGSQSWFNEAKFDLPKQLPARLTTIQKACLASVFETNPAACPPASLIGHAIVHTPVLSTPLAGPVYFVSHGGAKFPDAVIVLQGSGVRVNLTGETFIDGKTGVTSATFRNTPDTPFESIEVTVPSGPFSEFGANLPASAKGSFCGQKLVLPTFFKAQNGQEIHQNTPVGVTGCSTKASITGHSVHGKTITLTVYAPAAGKLKATGKGLSTATKSVTGTENVTLTLHAKRRGKFTTKVKLTFTPSKGKRQSTAVSIKV
jgi:uncharacterized repeat protein (TIGR01451 family)